MMFFQDAQFPKCAHIIRSRIVGGKLSRRILSASRLAAVLVACAAVALSAPTRAEEWRGASGDSYMPDKHDKFWYKLPPGKTPPDVVAMAIAGNDHVYAWYRDGTVSSGSSTDLQAHRKPYPYKVGQGRSIGDIVAIAIAKSNDRVYAWYRSGSVSSGTSSDLSSIQPHYSYTLPPGKFPDDIVDIGIAPDDHVYVWYKDATASSGTTSRLDQYRPLYKTTFSGFQPPEAWFRNRTVGMAIAGTTSRVYIWTDLPRN